jgi:hypothetical protein
MKARKSARKPERGSRSEPVVRGGLIEPPEEGLSVDPEELGQSFLRYATEQDNFETARAIPLEFAPTVEPPDDETQREPAAPGGSLWDTTVDKVLAADDELDPEALEAGELPSDESGVSDEPPRGVAQIDLTASVIEEASLLDAEADVLGEVVPADPNTEDIGRRRSRGGQPPREK